jgi:hypothetical protein
MNKAELVETMPALIQQRLVQPVALCPDQEIDRVRKLTRDLINFRDNPMNELNRFEPTQNNQSGGLCWAPAHNEERDIANTVTSLHRQSMHVDQHYRDLRQLHRPHRGNRGSADLRHFHPGEQQAKEALNQALAPLIETLEDTDRILAMVADSELSVNFVEEAIRVLDGPGLVGPPTSLY